MSPTPVYFRPSTFRFLRDLAENNDRDWFQANKDRYVNVVQEPAQQFISDFGPLLRKISPEFVADPRPVGGSMFRIYRDVRFSKDKSPYKTHTGIQFRHKLAKDVHAPGFYLHIQPGSCFAGLGLWRPDGKALKSIRTAIDTDRSRWKRIVGGKRFSSTLEQQGDSLKRAPKGYDPEDPMVDTLRRKDFIAGVKLTQKEITAPDFLKRYAEICRAGSAYIEFLCDAVEVPF